MNRRANRAWLPKTYLAVLIAAATPSILLAQEPLWGGCANQQDRLSGRDDPLPRSCRRPEYWGEAG